MEEDESHVAVEQLCKVSMCLRGVRERSVEAKPTTALVAVPPTVQTSSIGSRSSALVLLDDQVKELKKKLWQAGERRAWP